MRCAPKTTGVLGRLLALALGLILGGGGEAFAQGVQTASLTGSVTSSDGQLMPGVTVSITSRAAESFSRRRLTWVSTVRVSMPGA